MRVEFWGMGAPLLPVLHKLSAAREMLDSDS